MSGSHHPGATFEATVVSVSGNQVTFEAEPEDVEYFTVGSEYVLHVRAVDPGNGNGSDK